MRLLVFIVDDDPDYAALLKFQLKRYKEAEIRMYRTGEEALEELDLEPDLILLDLVMPGQGGLETLRRIKARKANIPVVVVSSQSVVSVALEALGLGAYDYVTKGHDDTIKIQKITNQIIERTALAREVDSLREQLPVPQGIPGLIGESAGMAKVLRMIQKALRGDLTVAIVGESGTGKELVAQAIHHNSSRKRNPFVVVNCAAIPHELMESEFFGHEKGSFTGAHARKSGKFEQAHTGTIFLDEIGEMELSLQAKLLRVLQNQEVQRVGGNEVMKVDVRVICATNKDVISMTQKGDFREDLYYRLFQFPVNLPALRDRDQDAMLLAEHFRKEYLNKQRDIKPRPFSAATRRFILEYPWPGNVRQLKNAVERALLISDSSEIVPDDLMLGEPVFLNRPQAGKVEPRAPSDTSPQSEDHYAPISDTSSRIARAQTPDDIIPLEEVKKQAVLKAYELCKGNVDQTSIRLGVTRSTIYRLLEKYKEEENADAEN